VQDSLRTYSQRAWDNIGQFRDIGYGYQWWSARAGEHDVNFAWGHGGNLIVLIHDLDMVVVVTADSFYGKDVHWDSWKYEKANIELVANFISSLSLE
jgi:CubicO group peptidase (beta-lactamase class C family)